MERIRERRVLTGSRVEYEWRGEVITATLENVSRHGLFLRGSHSPTQGDWVELRVSLPDGAVVTLVALVAHVIGESKAASFGRHPGLGFEFLESAPPEFQAFMDAAEAEAEAVERDLSVRGGRVLVLEAGAGLRARLSRILSDAGVETVLVENATEARVQLSIEAVDALVLDVSAADPETWKLLETVAQGPPAPGLPVACLGDGGCDIARLQAYRLGAVDYIEKPFTRPELLVRLHRVLQAGSRSEVRVSPRGCD